MGFALQPCGSQCCPMLNLPCHLVRVTDSGSQCKNYAIKVRREQRRKMAKACRCYSSLPLEAWTVLRWSWLSGLRLQVTEALDMLVDIMDLQLYASEGMS